MDALIYKTINDFNYIYETPSINGVILGVLKKGIQLEISSLENGWALCKYNNNYSYIIEANLQLVSDIPTSNVIIKYIDVENNEDIFPPLIIKNLKIGDYSFTYKNICGYTLNDDISKTISISTTSTNNIVLFKYKKDILTETLSVSYIDIDTQEELSSTIIYNSDSLDYVDSISSKFPNYSLISTEKTSTISTNLVCKYRKNTGSIKIMYMDENNTIELSDSQLYSNLEFGSYEYIAKDLSGFTAIGDTTKTVSLNYTNNYVILIFNYKTSYLSIDDSLKNEVPYISTYYIKPIVSINEDVIIDFYITDYYHKEYLDEDLSNLFTITIKIDGKPAIIKTNVTAGDHSINIGSFSDEKEQNFSIFCTDKYGRNSHELFNYFLVRDDPKIIEYKMTAQDLIDYNIKNTDNYEEIKLVNVDLSNKTMTEALTSIANNTIIPSKKYICFIGDSNNDGVRDSSWKETIVKYSSDYNIDEVLAEATATREGLQQLLDDKKAAGYNKITLLSGIYRIDHLLPIYVPSNLILDLNNSTIKLNGFTGNTALMLTLNNTFDSHVINGTIEGDYYSHDYSNSTSNSEWVNGINIAGDSRYSSFESLTIKDITGYGSGNNIANSRDGSLPYNYTNYKSINNTFKLGDIDILTGEDIKSTNRTTCDFIDIISFVPYKYLTVSAYLGYQGNLCGTWNILCHFYDYNKKYITSINGYQYRKIFIPSNSHYLRVTILNEAYPNNLTINLFRIPTHCSFKNIIHKNCRCVGMAQSAMKDMLVESCEFVNCGQTSAKSAYDAEDGWDMMQDCTFYNLNFHDNPNNEFLVCAGHNFTIKNITNGKIYFYERLNSFCIKNSIISSATLEYTSLNRSGYSRFYNNTCNGNIIIQENSASNLPILIKDCTIHGRVHANTKKKKKILRCTITSSLYSKESYNNSLGSSTFLYCSIVNLNGNHNYSGNYINCSINNFSGMLQGNFYFNNCNIKMLSCYPTGENRTITFENCNIINSSLIANYSSNGATITFNNCIINNIDFLLKLPHYSMKYPITLNGNTCSSTGTNGLIYLYDDRVQSPTSAAIKQETISLINNSIDLSNSKYVITGISENTKNNINIFVSKNNYTPPTLLLCDPSSQKSSNINITEN